VDSRGNKQGAEEGLGCNNLAYIARSGGTFEKHG